MIVANHTKKYTEINNLLHCFSNQVLINDEKILDFVYRNYEDVERNIRFGIHRFQYLTIWGDVERGKEDKQGKEIEETDVDDEAKVKPLAYEYPKYLLIPYYNEIPMEIYTSDKPEIHLTLEFDQSCKMYEIFYIINWTQPELFELNRNAIKMLAIIYF